MSDPRHAACPICSRLADQEYGFQKGGWAEEATCLPAAAEALELVRDFKPGSSRARQLKRCPQCGTYYLYRSDYEFLVNGTEDEEYLNRLSDEDADKYLK